MLKGFALGIVLIIAALGVIFVGLDIVDIVEVYDLPLPINILNTVFISAVAVLVAYVAARRAAVSISSQVLWLGCGVLALGAGSLFYGWLPAEELNTRITANEGAALIASALYLTGAVVEVTKPHLANPEFWRRSQIVLLCYLGIIAGIAVVTLLAFRGVIPSFYVLEKSVLLRSAVRITTIVLFLVSSFVYLWMYSRSQTAFRFWCFLGVSLFAQGSIFIFLGSVEGLVAWIGRAAQYAGGIYLLVAVLNSDRSPIVEGRG